MGDFAGRVVRVPLGGGELVPLATNLARPSSIAVDESYVYWTDVLSGQVLRLPKEGGTPEQLGPWQHNPEVVVARAEGVYWLNRGNPDDGEVVFLAKGTTEPKILVGSLHDASHLAVDGTSLWWMTDSPTGSLSKAPIGGSPIAFFTAVDTPRGIALDATGVFIASAGEIRRSSKDGGPLETIASPAVAEGMALTSTFLYWASLSQGVNKVPLHGGESVHVGDDTLALDVAVDDACVYWIGSGAWRAPR
jgi:sugar lactone lactonase YvrE